MAEKNPFSDFRKRYAGEDGKFESLSEEAWKRMQKAYQSAYNKIYTDLSIAKKDVNYATYAHQTQLLKQIAKELSVLKGDSGEILKEALAKVAEYSTEVAIKDLEAIGSEITKAKEWHYDYNRKWVQDVYKDSHEHIAAQTDKMAADIKTQLRKDAAMIFRRAAIEGLTRREAHKQLKEQISDTMPDFKFIDKAGRTWDTSKYFDMLTKTVMANSLRECYANTLIQEKQDLVKVSFNGAKDACTKWEGRVLSLTGATEGYPTVESARATKEVFHPRCKHRLVAYHQDIEDVFKAVEDGKTDEEILGPAPVERPRKPKVDPWTEDAFEKIGPQQGSNPGGLYQNKITGEKWYIKRPKSEEHAQNEYLAAKLYGLAGVETPELQTIRLNDGTLGIASKWVEGIKSVKSATPDKNAFKPFHAGFGADAWLANWDVAGATFDNIAKTADGKPLRLDVGGALLFRAQGGPKGGAFTNTVTELESLRDPNVNRNTALIFGPMEKKDLVKSLKALAKVDNQTIRAAVAEAGFIGNKGVELGDKLITRRDYLLAKAKELNKYGPRKPKETEGAKELGPNDYFVQKPASAAEIAKFRQRYIGDNGYPKQYESYTRNLRQTFKSLSLEEAHAIILYTNGEYERLNNWLRDNNAPKTDNILGHALAKLINSGLKKMRVEGRTYEGEWTRDIGRSNVIMEYAKENGWMNKGSIVRMKDFLSGCPGKKGWHGDATYQLRAKLKTGTNIGEFSRHPSEREVLVEAGTRFKIVDYKYQNGIHMWYVEEI